MEPIAYANGSTLDDPAITYGIVFSNFMGSGVYTFQGGSDLLVGKMTDELRKNGVELRKKVLVERVLVEERGGTKVACGIVAKGGRVIRAKAVLSNANIKNTVLRLAGAENFPPEYVAAARAVRINSSSCQVYLGIRKGETIPTHRGPGVHLGEPVLQQRRTDVHEHEQQDLLGLLSRHEARLGAVHGRRLDQRPLLRLEFPQRGGICPREGAPRRGVDPRPREVHSGGPGPHRLEGGRDPRGQSNGTRPISGGTSFGTKFEGLKVSMDLPESLPGLYHAGSVGIIMSGWLGTINYGVITANKVDRYVCAQRQGRAA